MTFNLDKLKDRDNFDGIYNIDVQHIMLALLISNPDFYQTCKPILTHRSFDDQLKRAVRFIIQHENEHGELPSRSLIASKTATDIKRLEDLDLTKDEPWFLPEFENFARHRALENTMLDSFDLIQEGQYEMVQERVNEAMAISITQNKSKFDETDFLEDLETAPPEYLLEHLLHEGEVGVLYGMSQAYKTFVLVDLCMRLAHGMEWQGDKLSPRNVIYVAGEGQNYIKMRRLAWLKHHDMQPTRDGFRLVKSPINLFDENEVREFIAVWKARNINPALVVLETLSTSAGGNDENLAPTMAHIVSVSRVIAQELSAAVVIAHHTGKDEAKGGRGSYALYCNIDFEWHMTARGDIAKLETTKQKDGPCHLTFPFKAHTIPLGRYNKKGKELISLAVVPYDAATDPKAPGHMLPTQEADRLSVAAVMEPGDSLTKNQLAKLVQKSLGLGLTATREKLSAAFSDNMWHKVRKGEGFIEIRSHIQDKTGRWSFEAKLSE